MKPSLAEGDCSLNTGCAAKSRRSERCRLRLNPEFPNLLLHKPFRVRKLQDRFKVLSHPNRDAFETNEADFADVISILKSPKRVIPSHVPQ